jgi:hypothetical protein
MKQYHKWIKERENSCFDIKEGKIICNLCSSIYGNKWKRKRYVSVGASPLQKSSLSSHIKSRIHINAKGSFASKERRKFLKFCNDKRAKQSVNSNSLSHFSLQNHSKAYNLRFTVGKVPQFTDFIDNMSGVILTNKELSLIPVIKDKLRIVLYMIMSNTANNRLASLQHLVNEVSSNVALKVFDHNSSGSFSDFVEILYSTYKNMIKKSINFFKYYGLLVDDSVNVCGVNQISIYVKYINENLEVVTSFLGIKGIGAEGATSNNLLNIILEMLKEWDLNLDNMVTFSSDGAANMRGDTNGLCALLKKRTLGLVDWYCSLHRLNLVLKFASSDEINKNLSDCIQTNCDIANYINNSSTRLSRFHKIQQQSYLRYRTEIIQPTPIRWSSIYNCIHSIVENISIIYKFFDEESELKYQKAKDLLKIINNYEFIRDISILHCVIEEINVVIKKLQEKNLDLGKAVNLIEDLKITLCELKIRNKPYDLYKELIKQCSVCKITLGSKKTIKNPELNILSITVSYIDSILLNMNSRFQGDMNNEFLKVFNPKILKDESSNEHWQTRGLKYGELVNQFKGRFSPQRFSERYLDYKIFKKKIIPILNRFCTFEEVCKFILTDHYFGTANTLVRIAHIAILISPTTATVESGFSIYNDIHSNGRSRIGPNMINFIMMLKVNLNTQIIDNFISNAALNWLRTIKKRRRMGKVIDILLNEGRIDFIPHHRQALWKEKKENEKEETTDEQLFIISALLLVKSDESMSENSSNIEEEKENERIPDTIVIEDD